MPKRKPTARRIATLDGLLHAIKQKLGPEADVNVSQSLHEDYGPGRTNRRLYWCCGADVTDRDGYRLRAQVYCCNTGERAVRELMQQLAAEAKKARQEAASARALEHRSQSRVADQRGLLLLEHRPS